MSENLQFTALAEYYDKLNGADYKLYADYIEKCINKFGREDTSLVLDLGCGTGSLTLELANRGYDMIGADISAEMLNIAMDRAYDAEKSILYLMQDMRCFELYGTVGAIICSLDGISYLESEADIIKTFKLVKNYLDPGGIFIFDINTPWKFRHVFADRDFFLEDEKGEVYLGWRNQLCESDGICNFHLTLFIKNEDGAYSKAEETQTEHILTPEQIKRCLAEAGLDTVAVHTDLKMTEAGFGDGEEKFYWVCRKQ